MRSAARRPAGVPWLSIAACVTLAGCDGSGLIAVDPVDPFDPPPEPPLEQVGAADAPRCEPVAAVDEPFLWEGDTAELAFECASGEPRDAFVPTLVSTAAGAELDRDEWTVRWSTGLADGGRRDFLVEVRPRDTIAGTDALPETALGTVWIADDGDAPGNVPVDPEQYTEEWGLPVIHLDPHGELGQEHVPTTIHVLGRRYDAEMKLRGAASLWYPKNSFNLRFEDPDLDAGGMGLGTKDHLILTTTFDDNSYVRQKLAYDLWAAIAALDGDVRLAPRTRFVVVYLHGGYFGLYIACDRIDDHFPGELGFAQGGDLFKAVSHDANYYRTGADGLPKDTLHDGFTKEEGAPDDWSGLDALVAFAADSPTTAFVDAAGDWIDVDEWIDWLLFVQYAAADDSAGKNAYLYDDPTSARFRYVPWDFNHAFGQGWTTYRIGPDSIGDYTWNNGVFAHLQAHPDTAAAIRERAQRLLDEGPLQPAWFDAQLDAYEAAVAPSAERDWATWGAEFSGYWGDNNPNDLDAERLYLRDWLAERDGWFRAYYP